MMDKSTRIGFGIVGNVFSILCAFCWIPLPRFVEFCSTRSLGNHSPAPHLFGLLSYMVWILYGCVHPNSILIITSNAACSLVVIYHLLLFTIRSKSWNNLRREVFALMILEIIFVGIVTAIVLTLVPDTKLRSRITGMIAMICQLGTYVSPILYMKLTITSRDPDHLNLPFATFSFVSCIFWFAYAGDPVDLPLFVPSVVGMILSMVEPFLEGLFHKSDSRKKSATNLELSQGASSPNGGCDIEAHVP